MPIFQDPERLFPHLAKLSEAFPANSLKSKASEESVRTEFCDGPLPDAPTWDTVENEDVIHKEKERSCSQSGVCTSDRNELIERIKRGESPTWIPSQTLQQEYSRTNQGSFPPTTHKTSTPLLPAADVGPNANADKEEYATELSPPSEIKRPRSALHAGDFNGGHQDSPTTSQNSPESRDRAGTSSFANIGTSPAMSWYGSDQRSQGFSAPHSSVTVQDTADAKFRNEADTTNKGNNKKRRRASPAPSNLQGGYRIPQKGQLQIVIKNPNKTAVKLFLVPYDLESMEAGTKTFIRQRCSSTDPVIEGMPSKSTSEPNLPSPRNVVKSKPTLRYLIHLNICSPSNGRFYLYQHIRVVFANRVPDSKEQLQTEIQVPQPRFSAYNPNLALSRSVSSSGAGLTKQNVYRRRSSGFGVGHEGMRDRHPQTLGNGSSSPFLFDSHPSRTPPVPCIQFQMTNVRGVDPAPEGPMNLAYKTGDGPVADAGQATPFPTFGGPEAHATPTPSFPNVAMAWHRPRATELENRRPAEVKATNFNRPMPPFGKSSMRDRGKCTATEVDNSVYRFSPWPTIDSPKNPACYKGNGTYSKLSKGDAGYGGRPSTPELGEGLLAKKLKGLEVQRSVGEEDKDIKWRWDGAKSGTDTIWNG
ncbi:MAG: hypothetical protein Q9208_001316 [Pyrenodesmia sp. 3 TL-2023]